MARGLDRRSLEGLTYLGLDEKSFGKGHDYVSVMHDVMGRRVRAVVLERTRKAADALWGAIPEAQRQGLAAVAADMWEPYLEATRECKEFCVCELCANLESRRDVWLQQAQ